MKKELTDMLKKTGIVDGIFVLLTLFLNAFIPHMYVFMIVLGLLMAYINFLLNGVITYFLMGNKSGSHTALVILGFLLRVLIVAGIGVMVFSFNKYYVLAYLLGYSLHFISIVIYGTNAK